MTDREFVMKDHTKDSDIPALEEIGRKRVEAIEKRVLDSFKGEVKVTHTRTYAVVEVSQEAYAEIRNILGKAGYQHAFHDKKTNENYDEVIDMDGLVLAVKKEPENA